MSDALAATRPVTGREPMALRIQRIINSPAAQKGKSAVIYKYPGEPESEWERILAAISENDHVTIAHRDDDVVQLFWTVPMGD